MDWQKRTIGTLRLYGHVRGGSLIDISSLLPRFESLTAFVYCLLRFTLADEPLGSRSHATDPTPRSSAPS